MNAILRAISLLGGLAMFLYGMEIMGDGLKQGSGSALKNVLGKLTHNAFMGMLTGTLVTAIIQSSTATIVLTVGLLTAGILNLRQAVSIVMGANIGTTVTAQIIRLMDIDAGGESLLAFFKPDALAPMALVIGIVLVMFIRKGKCKPVGMIFMGFGILFTGLLYMTEAVEPLAQSQTFLDILAYFSSMPLLGILTGLVLTVILQSSSAMVGILQALSVTGVMTFNLVYPLIMGINLGTCVATALVCSIGSTKNAKRTAVVHITFNVIGTIAFMIIMAVIKSLGGFPGLWDSISTSGSIANFQTIFNLATAFMLLPFTGTLVKFSQWVVKEDSAVENQYPELNGLDKKLMISPTVALAEAKRAMITMIQASKDNIERSLSQFKKYEAETAESILSCEERIDSFADVADNYLVELSRKVENEEDGHLLNMLMQCVPNVERVGDYATNLDEMAKKMADEHLDFSGNAQSEIDILSDAVEDILQLTIDAMRSDSESTARRIEPLEEVIDDMVLLLRNRHTARLCQGTCSIKSGLVFMDVLTQLERASDQCSNLAMLMLGRNNDAIMENHHQYLAELHASGDQSYMAEQERRRQQYLVALERIEA